jgi:hypothetical protein
MRLSGRTPPSKLFFAFALLIALAGGVRGAPQAPQTPVSSPSAKAMSADRPSAGSKSTLADALLDTVSLSTLAYPYGRHEHAAAVSGS